MRQLAVVRTYDDLVQVIRSRRDELDVPHEIIDEIAGLAPGHTSKLLAPNPIKGLGRVSWHIFEALGISLVAIENAAALKRAKRNHAWRERRQPQMLARHSYPGLHSEKNIKMLREIAALGGRACWAKLKPSQRSKKARKIKHDGASRASSR